MWADESAHMIGHHNWVQSLHSKQCCSLHASNYRRRQEVSSCSFPSSLKSNLCWDYDDSEYTLSEALTEKKERKEKKKSCPYLQKPLAIDSPGTHEKKQENNRNFRKCLWNRISLTPRRIKCRYIHLIYAMCSEGENIWNSFAFTKRMRSE